jgi:hypothetical protein
MRRALLCVALLVSAARSAAAPPDLSGIWQVQMPITQLKTSDGTIVPLRPEMAKLYQARMQQFERGDASFDLSRTQCRPPGEPRILYDLFPFEITQTPTQVFFTYQWNKLYRIVDIDEPQKVSAPTYFGTSNAHWRDDVLEIDVSGLHEDTLLDPSGLPHSEALRLSERFRLQDHGQKLVATLRFDDPKTFTKPWETHLTFVRLPTDRLGEDVCEERMGFVK